jgi:hypothetical protein
MKAFRNEVLRIWLWQLRRRSQRTRWTGDKFPEKLGNLLPEVEVLLPYPDVRFASSNPLYGVRARPLEFRWLHPRYEPCASGARSVIAPGIFYDRFDPWLGIRQLDGLLHRIGPMTTARTGPLRICQPAIPKNPSPKRDAVAGSGTLVSVTTSVPVGWAVSRPRLLATFPVAVKVPVWLTVREKAKKSPG